MTEAAFVDFARLKERVRIEQLIPVLNLTLKQNGAQYRGPCPVCRTGGDRALAINTVKNGGSYYCFAQGKGGDVISLTAHIRGTSQREAALYIEQQFGAADPKPAASAPSPSPPVRQQDKRELAPLTYLEAAHESVQQLGISAETARAWGAGYAPKGILRGRMAIPLFSREGTLLAYTGRTVKDESPTLTFPNGFMPETVIFGQERVTAGDLYIVRDPLQVLLAFEGGTENVVAFLTDGISAQQWEQLSSLMDEKQCERSYLF
jgi:CHC2 zinc finger